MIYMHNNLINLHFLRGLAYSLLAFFLQFLILVSYQDIENLLVFHQ